MLRMMNHMQSLKPKHIYMLVANYLISFTLLFWHHIAFTILLLQIMQRMFLIIEILMSDCDSTMY